MDTSPIGKRSKIFRTTVVFPEPVPPAIPIINILLILSISEQGGDPDKMSVEEIEELLKDFNFEFYKLYGTKNNFTINFKKK